MTFEEDLHETIDEWDLYTIEKIQLEEDILDVHNKYKQRVREILERTFVTQLRPEEIIERLDKTDEGPHVTILLKREFLESIKKELGL